MEQWLEVWWFAYIVLPVLIFMARILDVSLGTIRILFVARGIKNLAAILGFFEVFIWLLVISSIMKNLASPFYYLFYAGGFAAGNYVGMTIERKLTIGKVAIRVITRDNSDALLAYFREKGFGITIVDAQGSRGPVRILYSIIERGNLETVVEEVKRFNPRAFYLVDDVKTVSDGNFPLRSQNEGNITNKMFRSSTLRKGK
ncbi:MAG: DUF2179 domain-containing protein [Candidatus Marinimicrobia bacterium]|nr:DUF2179 domain-containing protein [FCB group bacterium]MBL7026173.1 DUF2179 domain-containing protein [Candidatus Neomarinimicrobiota bacterium]